MRSFSSWRTSSFLVGPQERKRLSPQMKAFAKRGNHFSDWKKTPFRRKEKGSVCRWAEAVGSQGGDGECICVPHLLTSESQYLARPFARLTFPPDLTHQRSKTRTTEADDQFRFPFPFHPPELKKGWWAGIGARSLDQPRRGFFSPKLR